MNNHMHCILSSANGQLSNTIREFKSFTSKTITKSIQTEPESRRKWLLKQMHEYTIKHTRNRHFQLWTHANHPMHIYNRKFINQKLHYIHQNPVKAGIVDDPASYLYNSARNYAGRIGLMEVDYIEYSSL